MLAWANIASWPPKGDNPEPLPYPTGAYLPGIEAAALDFGPGQGFFDESSLTSARLAGQQEGLFHFSLGGAWAFLFSLSFFWRCRCFKAATFFFLYISLALSPSYGVILAYCERGVAKPRRGKSGTKLRNQGSKIKMTSQSGEM
jgi:hypothetical protein